MKLFFLTGDLFWPVSMTSHEEIEKLQQKLWASASSEEIPKKKPKKIIPYITLNEILEKKPNAIEVRTGLSKNEFYYVLDLLKKEGEDIKRGPKLLDLDVRLLITLQWLQLNQTYKHIAFSLDIIESRVQTSITSIWDTLKMVLIKDLIPSSPFKYRPGKVFPVYTDALAALDATLIEIVAPSDKDDNAKYYSGKHCKHGGKFQVLVAPDGYCIYMSDVVCGSWHDFKLYSKSGLERILTQGRCEKDYPTILADGGYLGMVKTYPKVIIPIRKPKSGELNETQKEYNKTLSRARIVVERFFGRLKLSWGIMRGPYRSDRSSLDSLAKICVALTNLKIRSAPLFANIPRGIIITDKDPKEIEEPKDLEELVDIDLLDMSTSPISDPSLTIDDFEDFPTPKNTSKLTPKQTTKKSDKEPVRPPSQKKAARGSPKKSPTKK